MPKAVEVFTPNDLPTFTYVERPGRMFEDRLREALSIPKMIVSISGPSKSGKTVLVNRVIETDNLISVSGASIRTVDELWTRVLAWMESPAERVEGSKTTIKGEVGARAGGEFKLPLIGGAKTEIDGKMGAERSGETSEIYDLRGLPQVVKEIGGSVFVVFIDDFHYIPVDGQKDIGKQVKEASEKGVRIVTASVPHRSDDVVRSNTELRGRITSIDLDYWKDEELAQIVRRGFDKLNLDIAPAVLTRLTTEAFGSPQLMQAIALHFCFENRVHETLPIQKRIDIDFVTLQSVLERTSTLTDFSTMLSTLHAGPKQRGTERKEFLFKDGSRGDVYRCVLLAMKADPPRLSFRYDEILTRTSAQCEGDAPVGSSVAQALAQMEKLAGSVQEAPVIEWDEDVLDIVEPYFLFFLRSSRYLSRIT